MGDEQKYFTIQIKGEAYRFTPVSEADTIMIQTLVSMEAPQNKLLKGLMRILRDASTSEQWDKLSDRVVDREISLPEMMGAFKRLSERTVKTAKDSPESSDAE